MSAIWGGRTWLRLTKEVAWGVYNDDESAQAIWIRLDQDNAFRLRPTPRRYTIRSADARNEIVESGSAQDELVGSLNTLLYPEQADFLFGWGTSIIAAGSPGPLTYDLGSATADYYDGVRFRRYLGVKVSNLALTSTNSAPVVRLNLGLIAWKPDAVDPTLPEPAYSAFPTDRCYRHQDSAGLIKVGGSSARTKYREINFTLQNIIDAPYDEDRYPSDLLYCGRNVAYSFVTQYRKNETDREVYESQNVLANNIISFTRPGSPAKTLSLNIQSKAKIDNFEHDQPLATASYATINVVGQFDGAANTGFSYLVA